MEMLKRAGVFRKLNEFTYQLTIKKPIPKEEVIFSLEEKGLDVSYLFKRCPDVLILGNLVYSMLPEGELLILEEKKNFYIAFKNYETNTLIVKVKEGIYAYYQEDKQIDDVKRISSFVDFLGIVKKKYNNLISLDTLELYLGTNIVDKSRYDVIIEDEDIELLLPNFRKRSNWMRLTISLKDTHEDIGYIEFDLRKNNFCYNGNVSYAIKEKYQNKGYATKALGLVKKIVRDYGEEVDKCLYISTVKENIESQCVILNNGGKLYYEGVVPLGDKVRIYNKVDYVKIYTIDVSSIYENRK